MAVTAWEKLPDLSGEDQNTCMRVMQETTLLHLAVQASDPDLVSWLVNKGAYTSLNDKGLTLISQRTGARADECDAAGYTPLHRALENGDKKMLDYFFETFPPFNSKGEENSTNMKVYEPTKQDDPATSLVMLATLSGDAEVIDYVLDRGTVDEVEHCYRYARARVRQASFHKPTIATWKAVQQMLEQKEGFSPPLEFAARSHIRPHYNSRGGRTWQKHGAQSEHQRDNKTTLPAQNHGVKTGAKGAQK